MTLDQLAENESGIINTIYDEDLALQLLAMGFIIGKKVKIERIAPLKDPIIITSDSNHISIRKIDAQNIEIKRIV